MLAEHEEGRRLSQRMQLAVERLQAGDVRARDAVVLSVTDYIKVFRQHIYKEDNVLFPMADKVIPTIQQEQILGGFEQFERDGTGDDVHEKYFGLAERLEKECLR
jgi:hemerythrin-like domain-containing protein